MTPVLHLRAIRDQVALLGRLAEPVPEARFALRGAGIDPVRLQPLPVAAELFLAAGVDPLVETIMRWNREPGRNVEIAPAIYGGFLGDDEQGKDGSSADAARPVLGFAVAFEPEPGERGAAWLRLPFPPSAVLAAGDSIVAAYLFGAPEPASRALPVARHVAAAAGGRVVAAWPIAGTLYYPADYGQSGVEPQPIELVLPWQPEAYELDALVAAVEAEQRPQRVQLAAVDAAGRLGKEEAGAGDSHAGGSGDDGGDGGGPGDDGEDILAVLRGIEGLLHSRYRRLEIGSDIEIAKKLAVELVRRFGQMPYAEGAFWVYGGTCWAALDGEAMRRLLHSFDGAEYRTPGNKIEKLRLSKYRVDSAMRELAAMLAEPDFFAGPAPGINVLNGFIRFEADGTPQLVPHAPGHRQRHTHPGRWDKWADEEALDPPAGSLLRRLLDGCFGGEPDYADKCNLLAELAGAAAAGLATRLPQPTAFIMFGEKANNGKSTALDLLRSTLSPDAVCAVAANKFSDERHVIRLPGKLLNAPDELASGAVIGSDNFKKIVTGEPTTGRDVYKSAVEFRPMALHVFAANQLPQFSGGFDRGVQRRLGLLLFEKVIPEPERVEKFGALVAAREPDLVIAFAVAGARRLLRNRRYTEPVSSRRAMRLWLYGADPVLAYIRARLRALDPREELPGVRAAGLRSAEVYADFHRWAKDAGFREQVLPAVNGFVQRLNANADFVTVRHTKGGGRVYGCAIADVREEDDQPEEELELAGAE